MMRKMKAKSSESTLSEETSTSDTMSEKTLESYEDSDIPHEDSVFSISASCCDLYGSDSDDSDDSNELLEEQPERGFDRDFSRASKQIVNWKTHPQLPHGWEERVMPHTKETYFYDTKTGKVHYTLPRNDPLKCKNPKGAFNFRMRCRHILIKHEESETRISFWQKRVLRTKAEAFERITRVREMIRTGKMKFALAASVVSDCCTARKGGDMGSIRLGETLLDFEVAVARLEMYELSDIFETDSGYHIALRIPVHQNDPQAKYRRWNKRRLRHVLNHKQKKNKMGVKFSSKQPSKETCDDRISPPQDVLEIFSQDRWLPSNSSTFEDQRKEEMYARQQMLIRKNVIVDPDDKKYEGKQVRIVGPSSEQSDKDFDFKSPSRFWFGNLSPDDFHQW